MLERGISARTFRLGCTPIVNLFDQSAEAILLDQHKYEYPVIHFTASADRVVQLGPRWPYSF